MSIIKGKTVLVTGADGFIGSHLVESLVRQGARVRAMVMYNSFNSFGWLDHVSAEIARELEIVSTDVRDPSGVTEAVRGCEIVFHLAALIGIPYSYKAPKSYVDTNVNGTLNVLLAVRNWQVEKLVHTSTSEVYGSALAIPINEEHPLQPQSPYSATKIAADQLALSFHAAFNTPVTILRPFNTYGPRQSARAVIPTIITQIAKGQRVIELGSVYPTRDFNYVSDTVNGFIAAAISDNINGQVINLGSNYEISVGDTAYLIAKLMACEVEINKVSCRQRPDNSEVDRLWADNTKAKRLLGWEPEYAGIEGFRLGLMKTIDWFTLPENLHYYKPFRYNV